MQVIKNMLPDEYAQFSKYASVGLDWMSVDFTHTIPNWPHLLKNGFAGILKSAQESKKKLLDDEG